MSNPSYEYKKHLRENLPAGIEVIKNGYYVVAETHVLPKLANAVKYQEDLVRKGYDIEKLPPTVTTQVSITPATGPVGTVFTVNFGAATGKPTPTRTDTVTLNGTAVTLNASSQYTSTAEGTLLAKAVWINGVGGNVESSATATVTAVEEG